MGRPLNKKYFGNTNPSGTGGEGVASVALGTAGTGYSQGLTATVSAPQLPGTTATLSVGVNPATGAITGYTVVTAGSGYTATPTVTLVKPSDATTTATGANGGFTLTVLSATGIYVGMTATGTGIGVGALVTTIVGTTVTLSVANTADITAGSVTFSDAGVNGVPGTVTLTNTNAAGISISANIAGAGALAGDIIKQVSTRRYLVRTAAGTGICELVASAPGAGQMTITAVDSAAGTYYVKKLTARRAVIVANTGTQFTTGTDGISVPWSLDAAVLNVSVQVLSA